MKKIIDSIWDVPIFYKLLQATLASGGHKVMKNFLLSEIPKKSKTILDQGCGTGEYSLLFGDKYTGLDYDPDYMVFARKKFPGKFIVGDASNMKALKSNSFDIVYAIGLHHHLNDIKATKAFEESYRVVKPGGKVIVIDAMLPKNYFNLIGYLLRKMDRGGYVRRFYQTLDLIPPKLKYRAGVLSSYPFDYIWIIFEKNS